MPAPALQPPVTVQPWPGTLQLSPQGILVLGLCLPQAGTGDARPQARLAIRQALTQALAGPLQCQPADIYIDNQRGQPAQIRVAASTTPAPHCSFAYSDGYGVAAVNLHGPVGVDLTPVLEIPDWAALARDYLGPPTLARLQALPASQRALALAQAWCRLEALCKFRAEALTEWQGEQPDDALHAQLILPALPPPLLAGHVSWRQP
ncbi:4'-phosphopantetheinyl transferase superfamily protein [Pseudoduganella sp. FT93W]|uniref:4'-phosphopantetheinyl transferase superfamily protein n=1 Tax=Duganella fentianensis TaxID=2692177 RepID=A0A845I3L3_9BURK|nr:4'-phosphopantetheinyl transferase superfamily protein [Duganella fentianensis]MYN45428.1 4'-phosphopantetheinyl transferase superfamily protein [Duganella fentianensis]